MKLKYFATISSPFIGGIEIKIWSASINFFSREVSNWSLSKLKEWKEKVLFFNSLLFFV